MPRNDKGLAESHADYLVIRDRHTYKTNLNAMLVQYNKTNCHWQNKVKLLIGGKSMPGVGLMVRVVDLGS